VAFGVNFRQLLRHYYDRNDGFSLIELLTTLVIFAILCGYSLSFLSSLQKKDQLQVMANEIKQAIHFAKMEALAHAHTVTLTPLSGQKDWSAGMMLFVDKPRHRNVEKSSLIREWHWQHPGLIITWHGFESTDYIRFSPDLITRAANGYFLVEDKANQRIKLMLNRLARVRGG